jgi:hypothetical protein
MLTLTPYLIERLERAGNHRKTLQAYLGPLPVLRRDQYGAAELEAISDAELFVAQGPGPMTCRRLEMPGLIGIDAFAVGGGGQNLLLSEKGVRVGGIFQLLPFVPPAHRGRGLGALIQRARKTPQLQWGDVRLRARARVTDLDNFQYSV